MSMVYEAEDPIIAAGRYAVSVGGGPAIADTPVPSTTDNVKGMMRLPEYQRLCVTRSGVSTRVRRYFAPRAGRAVELREREAMQIYLQPVGRDGHHFGLMIVDGFLIG